MDKKSKGKISTVKTRLPHSLYEEFKIKALDEGYSMQQATYLLIKHYVSNTLMIKK